MIVKTGQLTLNPSFPRRREANFLRRCLPVLSWIPVCAGLTTFVNITSPAQAEIIIGVAGPMTGQYQIFGEQMKAGAQSAIDAINAHGGISGELLAMNVEDDGCDVRKAVDVAHGFVSAGVLLVVGHFCSNPALSAAKIYEAAGIPMIAPTASVPLLAEGAGWNVLRIASRDDAQAELAAIRISGKSSEDNIAVLDDGTAPNSALSKRFTKVLSKPVAFRASFKPDTKDFTILINDIISKNIGAIYFACSASDAGIIANLLRAAGSDAAFYGPDTLLTDQYWERAQDAGEGTFVSFAVDPQAAAQAKSAIAALKVAGFNADGATLPTYAAVQLFTSAAVQVSPKNGRAIIDFLESGTSFDTVLGSMKFDKTGEVQPPRFVWYEWHQGKYSALPSKK